MPLAIVLMAMLAEKNRFTAAQLLERHAWFFEGATPYCKLYSDANVKDIQVGNSIYLIVRIVFIWIMLNP